jgi:hypothetical protein
MPACFVPSQDNFSQRERTDLESKKELPVLRKAMAL